MVLDLLIFRVNSRFQGLIMMRRDSTDDSMHTEISIKKTTPSLTTLMSWKYSLIK